MTRQRSVSSMLLTLLLSSAAVYTIASPDVEKSTNGGLFGMIAYLGGLVWNIFYVFGTIPQYYPQMKDIREGRGDGFSPWLCWILLTANIIRIFYWFAEPFELVLLGQSIVMVAVQLGLLHAICYSKEQKMLRAGKPIVKRTIYDLNPVYFWKWDDFNSYVTYAGSLAATLAVLCGATLPSTIVATLLGYSGLAIEACLGLPQLYHNFKNGTEGLSSFLIWTWLAGDLAKTIFFISLGAPLPFVLCGCFQIFTDIAILCQIYLTKLSPKRE